MNSQGVKIVQTDALPPNTVRPLEPGATNIYDSAIIKSNNQNQLQNKLGGQNGGKRKPKRNMIGGSSNSPNPVIVVAPAPSYAVDRQSTNANNTALASLANINQSQAVYDNTVNGTQADTAAISVKQNQQYYGTKGGTIKKRTRSKVIKKGGSYPKWSCLSGGKKSIKNKKSCRNKRRKTCKHVKTFQY